MLKPSTIVDQLGLTIDSDKMVYKIPQEKATNIKRTLKYLLSKIVEGKRLV